MNYDDNDKKLIFQYWTNLYVTDCPQCHGTGKKSDQSMCDCVIKANTSANLEINGFGKKYLKLPLNNMQIKEKLNEYLKEFPTYLQDGKGLYIFGKHATDKTLALTALARKIMAIENPLGINMFSIRFFLYDDLVRFSYDDKSFIALETIIKKTNILVLDNIGVETGLYTSARSSVSLLENIVRNREMRGLPIWITSTLSKSKLAEVYNESIMSILSKNNIFICSSW